MAKKINSFNPIKDEGINSRYKRVVWSTKTLDIAVEALVQGKRLVANPFLDNNVLLLKPDIVYQRTDEEIAEWIKCKDDIIYFVENYCKIMTPSGVRKVKMREYQKDYLRLLEKERLTILCSARQAGKTVTSALFMLHYMCFNIDKTAMILGNRKKTATEVLSKAKDIFMQLPYFIKAGIHKWNESEIVLDNGCRVICDATTETPALGFTVHCMLWDEAAHCRDSIAETFYGNMFPTLQASKGKMMITSTTNGRNLFYRLFQAAKAGESEFAAMEVTWDLIPEWNVETGQWEQRDEQWKQRQIANLGSIEQFNKQFGTDFELGANTLVSQKSIRRTDVKRFINKDVYGVTFSNSWFWHPDFEPMNDLRPSYTIGTIDIAEGKGMDYTVCELYRMIEPGSDKLELIGYFRNNKLPRDAVALSIMQMCVTWTDPNHTLISFERNTYGEIFLRDIQSLAEKVVPWWDPSILIKYYTEAGTKFYYGVKITSGNKTPHCTLFKESFERQKTIAEAEQFMLELQNFSDDGTGHYKASYGHDDMVMCAVQLEFVKNTLQFKLMRDEFDQGQTKEDDTVWNPYDENDYIEQEASSGWDHNSAYNISRLR